MCPLARFGDCRKRHRPPQEGSICLLVPPEERLDLERLRAGNVRGVRGHGGLRLCGTGQEREGLQTGCSPEQAGLEGSCGEVWGGPLT